MNRLEEIKDEYAINQGFISWKELWFDTTDFKHANERIDEVMKIYAKECVEASLKKASENAETFEVDWDTTIVNKQSITNKENIILL